MAATLIPTPAPADEKETLQARLPMFLIFARMFDFDNQNMTTEEGWFRGVEALQVCGPGEDEKTWAKLKEHFGREDGNVHFEDFEHMLPFDPKLTAVLAVMVQAMASHAAMFRRVALAAATSLAAAENAAAAVDSEGEDAFDEEATSASSTAEPCCVS